jgi:hypothetical protein
MKFTCNRLQILLVFQVNTLNVLIICNVKMHSTKSIAATNTIGVIAGRRFVSLVGILLTCTWITLTCMSSFSDLKTLAS